MARGIYQIQNQVNGNCYIGSSVNLRKRWQNHLANLRHEHHRNPHLQAAFNKYGEEAFAFTILEGIEDASQLIPREQYYLDTLKPQYNIAPAAGRAMLGRHHTAEAKRKIGEAQKGERNHMYGKCRSEEVRRRISESERGKHLSEEHKRKIAEAKRGKPRSIETRRKISESKRGKPCPHKGYPHTEETRKKLSEAGKAYWRRIHALENQ